MNFSKIFKNFDNAKMQENLIKNLACNTQNTYVFNEQNNKNTWMHFECLILPNVFQYFTIWNNST